MDEPTPPASKPPFTAGLPDGPLERPSDFPDYDGPLVCPFYGPDHPARRDEESTEAFNEDVARVAFGDATFNRVQRKNEKFRGDWWLLTRVHHAVNAAERDDPGRENTKRFKDLNDEFYHLERLLTHQHLEAADFRGAPLDHARLEGAYLQCADFCWASLVHTRMRRARLSRAKLVEANLVHTYFNEAQLDYALLSDSDLQHAHFYRANLSHAYLLWSRCQHANFSEADLSHAKMFEAKCENASLYAANFAYTQLSHAHLDHSEIRDAKRLLLDDNPADRMRIEGSAQDPWSVLRRTYTGPRYFVQLVLTIAFLLPFALKAFHLTALGEAYEAVAAVTVERGHEGLDAAIPRAGLREMLDRSDRHHAPAPAWWVLVGGLDAWYFALMTMVVAAYNLLRIVLTLGVPPWLVSAAPRTSVGGVTALREAEERSRVTPALEDYYGPLHPLSDEYKRRVLGWSGTDGRLQPPERERGRLERIAREWAWLAVERLKYNPRFPMMTIGLYRMHLFARLLFWLAAGAFVFHLMHWVLTATVPVPIDALL